MQNQRLTLLRLVIHSAAWLLLAHLVYAALTGGLTANPIQALEQNTGRYALTFLVLSLACTPAAAILGWKELNLRRKALGLYGGLYAALHVTTFFILDYGLDLAAVWRDVGNKAYIVLGLLAFLLLLPLIFTSSRYWMKRLGRDWKRLHRLVYLISPLVVAHYLLVVKGNVAQLQGNLALPLIYGSVVLVLLAVRLPRFRAALLSLRARLAGPWVTKGVK
jgi:methionine sulfoxide reductase heme-binding subunit